MFVVQGNRGKESSNTGLCALLIFSLLIGASASPSLSAETRYPERAINMIVPWAPGGSSDLTVRLIADKIQEFLGQPIISQYKPGGGGSLGPSLAAKAKPDGYTIFFGSTTPMILAPIVKKLDYQLDDFVPMGMYGKLPFLFCVKPDARWKTLREFVEEEKKSPGKLRVGSNGKLTSADMLIELLNKSGGIRLTNIPFKSTAEALTAVLGEKIDAAMVAGTGGLLDSGQIRVLGYAEAQRLKDLPAVPTFRESGYNIVLTGRNSLWMPKKTPKEIVDKFSKTQEMALTRYSREVEESLKKFEMYMELQNPEETMREFKKEYDLLYKIADELGVVAK